MNEASVRLEVYHSLQGYGYWPLHMKDAILCPRCGCKILPAVAGRPDILVLDPLSRTLVCEVKIVDLDKSLSFAFTQIEDDQRRWMTAWMEHEGRGFIAIGTLSERPRRLWVIPWSEWIYRLEPTFKDREWTSIPVDHKLYKRISKNIPVLSMVTEFEKYQMLWVIGKRIEGNKFSMSHWEFPEGHEIAEERTNLWKKI